MQWESLARATERAVYQLCSTTTCQRVRVCVIAHADGGTRATPGPACVCVNSCTPP